MQIYQWIEECVVNNVERCQRYSPKIDADFAIQKARLSAYGRRSNEPNRNRNENGKCVVLIVYLGS